MTKAFQQAIQGEYRMGGIGIFRLFPPTKRAWPLALPQERSMNAVASRLPALIGGSADL
jgi:hypothetical protein